MFAINFKMPKQGEALNWSVDAHFITAEVIGCWLLTLDQYSWGFVPNTLRLLRLFLYVYLSYLYSEYLFIKSCQICVKNTGSVKSLSLNFIPFYLFLTLFSFPHIYKMSFMWAFKLHHFHSNSLRINLWLKRFLVMKVSNL